MPSLQPLNLVKCCLVIPFISNIGRSELRVEDLRGHLTDAVTNIVEVLAIETSHALRDAGEKNSSVGDSQAEGA